MLHRFLQHLLGASSGPWTSALVSSGTNGHQLQPSSPPVQSPNTVGVKKNRVRGVFDHGFKKQLPHFVICHLCPCSLVCWCFQNELITWSRLMNVAISGNTNIISLVATRTNVFILEITNHKNNFVDTNTCTCIKFWFLKKECKKKFDFLSLTYMACNSKGLFISQLSCYLLTELNQYYRGRLLLKCKQDGSGMP